nr:hypothetical protein Iba_chr03dCG1040 [Ipomoea batatas]
MSSLIAFHPECLHSHFPVDFDDSALPPPPATRGLQICNKLLAAKAAICDSGGNSAVLDEYWVFEQYKEMASMVL